MEVLIDGVRYVPDTSIEPPTDRIAAEVVFELVTAVHLYSSSHGRNLWNTVWDALRRLSPDLAMLAVTDACAAYGAAQAQLESLPPEESD